VEFKILGPLEVVEDGLPLPLGRGRERALLALLLLRANEVVSADRLIDELWRGQPPATATKALQVYVSRLRQRLGANMITTRSPGYAIEVGEDQLDLIRFERSIERARGEDPRSAASLLRDALSLWRGSPLSEFASEPFAQPEILRLEELRLAALEDRIDADLELGRGADLTGELELLVHQNPYRERLRRQLMLALYRSGRQADALSAYRDARSMLSQELGLEPSPELRELERQILAHDEALSPLDDGSTGADLASPVGRRNRRWRALVVIVGLALLLLAGAAGVAAVTGTRPDVVEVRPNAVAVIDPTSNRVVSAVQLGDRPTEIAIHGDAVWILHPDARSVSLVSRSKRKLVRTVGLGGAPSALAADRRGAWLVDARTADLTLIEPERLTISRTIRTKKRPSSVGMAGAGPLAAGLGSIWLASGQNTITRIDAQTGRLVTRIGGVETATSLGGIAVGADSVWVAGPLQESMITRIDPRRNAVSARIFIQKFRLNGIALGGGGVWVSDVGNDQVWLIDPVRNQPVGTTMVGGQPLGLGYGAGSIWVANSGDGTVSRIDPASRRVVATIPVGGSPNGIAATDDGIWVTVA